MTTHRITVRSAAQFHAVFNAVIAEVVSASSAWARSLLEEAAKEVTDQIRRDYVAKSYGQTDAAGIHWDKSQAAQQRGGLTMIETGSSLEGLTGRVASEGGQVLIRVQVENTGGASRDPTQYFKYVFYGTKDKNGKQILPPRPAWPEDGSLPDSWTRVLGGVILSGIADEVARRLVETRVAA
jgi:hypothetical protein